MALFKRYTWTFVILSGLVFLLSSLTSFVGVFFNFTGRGGEDLASIGMNTVAYTMRAGTSCFSGCGRIFSPGVGPGVLVALCNRQRGAIHLGYGEQHRSF